MISPARTPPDPGSAYRARRFAFGFGFDTFKASSTKPARNLLPVALRCTVSLVRTPRFATYRRMDEVLFNMADLLRRMGKHGRARQFFGNLIRNYPQSRFLPDAYLSFAEHYFRIR